MGGFFILFFLRAKLKNKSFSLAYIKSLYYICQIKIKIMKKLLLFLAFCAISCNNIEVTPIEKYGGKKYVIVDKIKYDKDIDWLQLKNPDTIFYIKVLNFDSARYKVGDTIK